MDLDHRRAERRRRLDLRGSARNEQRNADAGVAFSSRDHRRELIVLAGDVEPALGGALLAPLRHEAGGVRPWLAARSPSISRVAAISKFSGLAISRLQPLDVGVADVAAVLAQMRGDAVGAGRDRGERRLTGSGCRPPRALRMVAT